jgi:transposase
MAGIRIPRRRGRPRTRPAHLLGDKGYSVAMIRAGLRRRGIKVTIPERRDQQRNRLKRGRRGGRPPGFDRDRYRYRYRQRNTVERAISKLKQFRAVATRYDKRAFMYLATIDIATIKIWLRDLTKIN